MKIFLDTAHRASIKKWSSIIDGVTTNPTHLSVEGGDPKKVVEEICKMLDGKDVSVEVTETQPEKVYKQAQQIADIAENVVVKIPCDPLYFETMQQLLSEAVRINVTLIFSLLQGLIMCKFDVDYISPFVGRLEDIDVSGIDLVQDLRAMIDQYNFDTQVLAASLRSVQHFHQAIIAGADAVTLPVEVFEKSLEHPLTKIGMKKFLDDWQKLGITKFP